EFNSHLEYCMACATKVIAEKELDKLLKEKMAGGVTVADGLNERIIKALEKTPLLRITNSEGQEEIIALKEKAITFGRDPKNTVALPSDVKLSREHCRIEYKDGKYEIVDQNSSNGVYVNEQKVASHLLAAGDKIRIGRTHIVFELLLPGGQKEEKTKETPPQKAAQPAHITVNGTRPVTRALRMSPRTSALPYVAAAAVLAALVLFFVVRSQQRTTEETTHPRNEDTAQTAPDEQPSKLQYVMNKLRTEVNSLTNEYRYAEAMNKCQEFLNQHSGETTESEKNYLEKKIAFLEQAKQKDETAKKMLEQAEKETKDTSELKVMRSKYEGIAGAASATSVEQQVNERISLLNDLEKAQAQNQSDLASGNYGRIIARYTNITAKSGDTAIKKLAAKEIAAVNQKAKADFESIISRGRELADKNEYQKAKDLYLSNLTRFQGTDYLVQLNSEVTAIDKLRVQDTEKKTLAKKTSEKILGEVAQLSNGYNYQTAIQKSTEALKIMEECYPRVSGTLSEKMADMEKEAAIFGKLVSKINGRAVSITRLNIQGAVSNANNNEFTVSGKAVKWSTLNPEEMYSLYKMTWLTTSEPDGAAVFCLEHKLMDYAFEALNLLHQKSAKRKPELDALLSRYSGKEIPQGGFIIYKNKWLTPEEKTAFINIENATALANKIAATSKIQELEKSYEGLEQMMSAYSSQKLEIKKIIVSALEHKTSELKTTIQKKLVPNNLEQLSKLKKELNEKRKEALKEIRTGKPSAADSPKPVTSKEMDEKVKAVRAIWEKPAIKALEIDKSLNQMAEMLKFTDAELKKHTAKPKTKDEENTEDDTDILATLVSGSSLDVRNFPLNKTEARMIELNQKIMKENEANKTADSAEIEMVKVINEYRIMLGLQAYRINDLLAKAARKHSQHMQSVGQLAHDGIGDGTPSSRAAAEGYSGPLGENCATGQGSPVGYFTAWYWSYGHHLNMIGSWMSIGPGIAGDYATTKFGGQ
ncbi:MAG: FHA domain-containing protein, partial [Planctomycetota bacterium]